jgi:hypothetical protein
MTLAGIRNPSMPHPVSLRRIFMIVGKLCAGVTDRAEFRSGKASDIVSTLVSIYETRAVIVKELQALLATRLLAVKDYDAVKEVRPTNICADLANVRFAPSKYSRFDLEKVP